MTLIRQVLSDERVNEVINLSSKKIPVPDFEFKELKSLAEEVEFSREQLKEVEWLKAKIRILENDILKLKNPNLDYS